MTKEELATLARCAANKDSPFYHGSLWMQRKLRIAQEPTSRP